MYDVLCGTCWPQHEIGGGLGVGGMDKPAAALPWTASIFTLLTILSTAAAASPAPQVLTTSGPVLGEARLVAGWLTGGWWSGERQSCHLGKVYLFDEQNASLLLQVGF